MRSLFLFAVGAVSILACSSQVDPTYRGEPLLSAAGRVVASSTSARGMEVDAAIAWIPIQYEGSPDRPTLLAERVQVGASFPADFELTALTPPPPAAMVPGSRQEWFDHVSDEGYTWKGFATGYVVALARGVAGPSVQPSDVAGVDVHHLIVWFDHDDPSDPGKDSSSIAAEASRLHIPATKGYHLVTLDVERGEQRSRCYEGDLCVKDVFPSCATTSFIQQRNAYQYERCLGRSTKSCTFVRVFEKNTNLDCMDPAIVLTAEEQAENVRCLALVDAVDPPYGASRSEWCEAQYPFREVPPVPIEIELGTSLFAAF